MKPVDYFLLLFLVPTLSYANEFNTDIEAPQMQFSSKTNSSVNSLLLNSKAHIEITGLIAKITLIQKYKNPTKQWVEGIYLLPLPEDAAIDVLRIKTKNGIIEGIIQEKEKAKVTYQKARREGKKAAIVNSERPNLFTTKVANIAPDSEIDIEISYLQTVNYADDTFSITLPNTLTPRYTPKIPRQEEGELDSTQVINSSGWNSLKNINPPQVGSIKNSHQITLSANITRGMPLANIYSASHDIVWTKTEKNYHITLKQQSTAMNQDFVLSWQPQISTAPVAAVFSQKDDDSNYVSLLVMPPQQIAQNQVLPREIIFVIDSSGSMKGSSMRQAKASLQKALALLSPQDIFNIIEFDSHTQALFQHTRIANTQNIQQAKIFVQNMRADGGTEIKPALNLSLAEENNEGYLKQVIFLTDGSVGNEQELLNIIHEKLGNARLFTIGIGSAPNTYFMRKSAEYGRGSFTYVHNMAEIEKQISLLFVKLKNPVLSDITIQWDDGSEVEYFPNPLPDLYLGEPLMVYAKTNHNTVGKITVKGKLRDKSWSRKIQYNTESHSNGIAKVWARQKIEYLMDQTVLGVSQDEIKQQILPVALRYNLVSKYTSLIAVEKEPSRPSEDNLTTNVIPNLMPKGSQMVIPYPKTATNAQLFMIIACCFLFLSITLILVQKRDHLENNHVN